jgi:hypothetical protein
MPAQAFPSEAALLAQIPEKLRPLVARKLVFL